MVTPNGMRCSAGVTGADERKVRRERADSSTSLADGRLGARPVPKHRQYVAGKRGRGLLPYGMLTWWFDIVREKTA